MESAVSFFWLYRKVKKGKLYGRSKNQNPVRGNRSLDGGYGRRVSELLPPTVAAEEMGAEEPGGDEGKGKNRMKHGEIIRRMIWEYGCGEHRGTFGEENVA